MAAGVLQNSKSAVEIGAFVLEIGKAGAELSHLGDKSRVVLKDMANSVRSRTPWGIQLGLLDKVGRYIEGLAHNRRYIKPAPEALPVSGAG